MKSQVVHTMWCCITGEAVGEIWNWLYFGSEKVKTSNKYKLVDLFIEAKMLALWCDTVVTETLYKMIA